MSDLFEEPEDATPLTAEEKRELIPAHIAYRRELNEAEQENIARAQDWALNRPRDPVSEKFISRSRDHDCSQPPPRIRTSGFPASGSCLR
jgi:fido (protein-threonine AMPylation protein)